MDVVVIGLPLHLLLSGIFDCEGLSRRVTESRHNTQEVAAADALSSFDFSCLVNSLTLIFLAPIIILLWVSWGGRTRGKKRMKAQVVCYPDYSHPAV